MTLLSMIVQEIFTFMIVQKIFTFLFAFLEVSQNMKYIGSNSKSQRSKGNDIINSIFIFTEDLSEALPGYVVMQEHVFDLHGESLLT